MRPLLHILRVLLLLIAPAVVAGTPFSQMADVGPISTWPHPTTFAFHDTVDRLISNRLAESQIMRARVRYIRQAFDGSATGGGTSGTSPQTAWKCRTMADVRALLQAQMLPETTILFRNGDTFYSEATNTPQGIPRFLFGHYTFASYIDPNFPSLSKPRLLGFFRLNPTELRYVWTQTYKIKTPCNVYWVRGRRVGTDAAYGYRDVPYTKYADVSVVRLNERCWAIDSELNLHINLGLPSDYDDSGTLEAQVSTGPGIAIYDVDDVRLDNLIIEGWGMDVPSEGDGSIRADASGTNSLTITRCDWGWTAYHGLLHGNSLAGGIILAKDCSFGYHVNRDVATGGNGDALVSYARGGQNELVLDNCRSFGGGLNRADVPGSAGNALGAPVYQHSRAGYNIALHLRRDCTFTPIHPTRAHYASYLASGDAIVALDGSVAEVPADPLDIRHYRAFVINETAQFEGSLYGGAWRAVDINCRTRVGINAGIPHFWGVLRNAYAGMSINRDMEIAFDPSFLSHFALGQCSLDHNHAFIHGRIRLTGAHPFVPHDFLACEVDPIRLSTSRLFATVISNETQADAVRWNYPNQDGLTNPGGMANCAFYNIPTQHFDQSRAPIVLGIPANYSQTNMVPSAIIGRSSTLPQSLRLEYDALMQPRPELPTLGPIEGTVTRCPADFNYDDIVDFFDFLDFVAAWSSENPMADFNADLVIDLFDYLDFVTAFSTGC